MKSPLETITKLLNIICSNLTSELLQIYRSKSFSKFNKFDQKVVKLINTLKDKRSLIILDNIEDPLHSDEYLFKIILKKLLDNCPHVKILVTSKTKLDKIGTTEEKIVYIPKLSEQNSVKLFFQKAEIDLSVEKEKLEKFLDQTKD